MNPDNEAFEQALRRARRCARVLAAMSDALDGAEDEVELFQGATRVVVTAFEHAAAWIGLAAEDERRRVLPVAYAGLDAAEVEALDDAWADADPRPTGAAIRARMAVSGNDARRGPVLALPLLVDGRAGGALTVYAQQDGGFDAEETALLGRLSRGVGRSWSLLRARRERRHAEALRADCVAERRHTEQTLEELHDRLQVILGYCELLLEDGHGPLNHEQRATVGGIEDHGRHLVARIGSLVGRPSARFG
jgi:hypothetical protein